MVRSLTVRPGSRLAFFLGSDLALKPWNYSENSASSAKMMPSETRLSCFSVRISLLSRSSTGSVSTETETVARSLSLR